jgi:uncharacterized Fe-S radical SAM superfamily protein PflX
MRHGQGKPEPWQDKNTPGMKDTQAEVLKLRKQLVSMEKGRKELVSKSSMQQRSAQMTIAGQQRTLAEKSCGLDRATAEHYAAAQQIASLTEQLQHMAEEREQLKGAAAHGRLMVEAAEHSFRGNLGADVQFNAR